jgi:hypothetical protein
VATPPVADQIASGEVSQQAEDGEVYLFKRRDEQTGLRPINKVSSERRLKDGETAAVILHARGGQNLSPWYYFFISWLFRPISSEFLHVFLELATILVGLGDRAPARSLSQRSTEFLHISCFFFLYASFVIADFHYPGNFFENSSHQSSIAELLSFSNACLMNAHKKIHRSFRAPITPRRATIIYERQHSSDTPTTWFRVPSD